MAAPLLKTKLYVPPTRPELVQRPRLIKRLAESLRSPCRLVLVSAPAGFGKTTLLASWVEQTHFPVAWLSLDPGDNDPARFWSYVIHALQAVEAGTGQAVLAALESPQPPSLESVLTGLVNEFVESDLDWVLVLDDFHAITEGKIHHSLVFLLDHLPLHVHLIVSTRADPPWPLARLRVRGEMTELRTQDLRFTLDEASAFMTSVMGLDLTVQDVAALDSRTEGWIAGLQLAALSMQGRDDAAGFVRAFSGSHRFVLDYLMEEVLERQPDDIRDFLIKTSILERLSGSLCDAVLDIENANSVAILARLERSNAFLTPLDDERQWYRYHHLFADLLSGRLSHRYPDLVPVLHRRASEWYEAQDLIAEAIEHALRCADVQRVEQLIAGHALAMMEHGELATLQRLLDQVPKPSMRAQPWFYLARAWMLMFTGQIDGVEPALRDVENALSHLDPLSELPRLVGHITSIRAGVAYIQGNMTEVIQLARKALVDLRQGDLAVRGWVMVALGLALAWQGHLEEGERVLRQALDIGQARRGSYVSLLTLCNIASTQMDQGHLVQAADTFHQAIELGHVHAGRSGQPLSVTSYAYVYLADILREWNDLDAAQEYIQKGMELCVQWGEPQLLASAYARSARIRLAIGDADGARAAVGEAKRVARDFSAWYADRVAVDEIGLLLELGEVAAASQRAERLQSKTCLDEGIAVYDGMACLVLSRLYVAQGKVDQALDLLSKLVDTYERAKGQDGLIKTLIEQAIAFQVQGNPAQAVASLKRALTLAEPEGYVRAFVEGGASLGGLLRQLLAQGFAVNYVLKILSALDGPGTVRLASPGRPAIPLADPLSDRELEVLRLLLTDLSSTEIARQLYLSKNTVRSHVKHIYEKLGTHSREEAVQRAQELGLV